MRCVIVFFALVLMYGASDRAYIEAANPTDPVLHLEQMYNDLTVKLAAMDNRLRSVHATTNVALMTLEGKVEKANAELNFVKSDLQLKSEQLKNVTRTLTKKRSDVGFLVKAGSGNPDLPPGLVIRFVDTIMNKGNGYNVDSAMFTASVQGNYLFWVGISSSNTDRPQPLNICIRSDSSDGVCALENDGMATTTAMFHLTSGAHVWFFNEHNSAVIRGNSLSSYGGVLLSAD